MHRDQTMLNESAMGAVGAHYFKHINNLPAGQPPTASNKASYLSTYRE